MNRDYSKMSDSDLTKAVAERLGWTSVAWWPARHDFVGTNPKGTKYCSVPDYSTSIADAWTLVPTIDEHHRPFVIGEVYQGYEPVGWRVDLVRFGEKRELTAFEAPTAPRAICIAFLTAHDSDVERGALTPQGEKKQ